MRIPNFLKELQLMEQDYAKGIITREAYLQRRLYLQELSAGRVKPNEVYIEPILLEEEIG